MYLPTMREMLEALQRAMAKEVIPFIEDSYGLHQARMVTRELAHLARLSEILPGLLALENGERRNGLHECARSLAAAQADSRGDGAGCLVREISAQLARSYLPEVPVASTEDLAREHQNLGTLTERTIEMLEELRVQDPTSQALSDARQALRKVILAEADRRNPLAHSSEK